MDSYEFGSDYSASDASQAAGDELRAMPAAVLASHLAAALAEGLPADKVARLNYYLQLSMGTDSMRELSGDLRFELGLN